MTVRNREDWQMEFDTLSLRRGVKLKYLRGEEAYRGVEDFLLLHVFHRSLISTSAPSSVCILSAREFRPSARSIPLGTLWKPGRRNFFAKRKSVKKGLDTRILSRRVLWQER